MKSETHKNLEIGKLKSILMTNDSFQVFLIAVINRLLVIVLGFIFVSIINGNWETNNLYKAWIQWDGGWYLDIVKNGYDNNFPEGTPQSELCVKSPTECQRNFAFFPLYPLSIKTISTTTTISPELVGLVFSNTCFVFAIVFLYKLVKQKFSQKIGLIAVLTLMFSPVSYVFSGYMTESLFLLLLVLTYYFAEKKNWIIAGICGSLLSATRVVGILGISILIIKYLEDRKFKINIKEIDPKFIISLLIFPIGIIAFSYFLKNHIGDYLAFASIQKYWARETIELNPITLIYKILFDYSTEGSIKTHFYNLFYLGLLIFSLIYSLIKKLLPLSLLFVLTWVTVALIIGASLVSLPRYIAVLFPIYIILAHFIQRLGKIKLILIPLSSLILGIIIYFYVNGYGFTV